MSGQHWIDGFFRKRMEQRDFPVEAGEFEDVRALLEQRNSTAAGAVRGGFSKWWLSALIPVAGLLWWAFGGNGDGTRADVDRTAEEEIKVAGSVDQHVPSANGGNADVGADHAASIVASRQASSEVNGTPTAVEDDERSSREVSAGVKGVEALLARPDGIMAAKAALHSGAIAHSVTATPSDRNVQRSGPVGTAGLALRETNGSVQQSEDPLLGRVAVSSGADERSPETSVAGMEHRSARDAGMVVFLELRMPTPSMITTPEPVRCELPVFERIPMGALHAFGAPLTVRTRSSNGERSGAEAGSRFGLEYRVRSKRFVWATGVHYGSYALKADAGAIDVKLNFVEVPVSASYQVSRGRFGFAIQGGLSVDLLFNSRGRYPVEGDRSGTAFPDDAFHTANLSWCLRPQLSYHVNEHLSVNAGPLWKAQLSDVAKSGPLEDARISSSGIAIGITWSLDHTTF